METTYEIIDKETDQRVYTTKDRALAEQEEASGDYYYVEKKIQ